MSQSHALSLAPGSSLIPFDAGAPLEYIEQDGEILFTADEVGRHLGYANPAHAVHKLYRQNQSELKHYSTETKTVSVDGKLRETRAFSEEGVYILTMLARTNEAKKFRARVALLLRRVRREREARMIELAREAGFHAARELLGPETETRAMAEGFERGVSQALSLTDMQRGILKKTRRYLDMGLSKTEAAKLLGVAKDTVHRTLRKVRL